MTKIGLRGRAARLRFYYKDPLLDSKLHDIYLWIFNAVRGGFRRPANYFLHIHSLFHYHPQRTCGKAMFSQVSVILFTGGGVRGREGHAWWGLVWWGEGMCMAGDMCGRAVCGRGACVGEGACISGGIHGRRDGHCSGRYASCCNAFLFWLKICVPWFVPRIRWCIPKFGSLARIWQC